MRSQSQTKTHETAIKELRNERHTEESRLQVLKARVQDSLSKQQPTLFPMHTDGRINAA